MTGQLFDVKQVQEALKLSERTVFRLIKNGELKGFKVGREWRFEQKDIDAYIEHQRKKAEAEEDTQPRPAIKKTEGAASE